MGTRIENTVAGNVILLPADPYSPERLLRYHTSLSLVEGLVQQGKLSLADYKKAVEILSKKYGFPRNSIYTEIA